MSFLVRALAATHGSMSSAAAAVSSAISAARGREALKDLPLARQQGRAGGDHAGERGELLGRLGVLFGQQSARDE